ncbi:MAG: histidine--tRNA ligase [Methanolinea sp.]|nr:histidine--tRNA ligase [Methanolinea sp.]
MLQKPRGTRDFLPGEMEQRRSVEATMRRIAQSWGYREVCTPTFEELELFTLRSGEGIIEEMYVFEDKGGRKLALRPEVTASVLRAYVNVGKTLPKPLRWYYFSDCFRYERPQKGRYRQFWQFGVELIGADTPLAEAEVIMLARDLLSSTGISFSLHVGHLGFMQALLGGLPPEERKKVRVLLDKKNYEGLSAFLASRGEDALADRLVSLVQCRKLDDVLAVTGKIPGDERIRELFAVLDDAGVSYTLDPGIARGLDYYTGMVFEAFAENLGAENQVAGGGTYRLAHLFGGEDTPSCGFAIGFDRVMVARGEVPGPAAIRVGVAYTPEARRWAFRVAGEFRAAGIPTEMELSGKGISQQIASISRNADYALIIGRREEERGVVTLKDLRTGVQKELLLPEAIGEVSGGEPRG